MPADPVLPRKAANAWALVLMGGGARGLAHIGVLRVLEKNGLTPDVITGTSMGGIVGGLFAAGYSGTRLLRMVGDLSLNDFIDRPARRGLFKRRKNLFEYVLLNDYRNRLYKRMGLDKEDAVETRLKGLVGDIRIEDLTVKFACNAVDLVSGKEVVFTEGELTKALRATISLPLLFAPSRQGGMRLLDGGVLNNAPVEAARRAGAAVAVLVDIHRPLRRMPAERIRNTFQVVQRMIEVSRAAANEERTRQADLVLRVPIDVDTLDFSNPGRIVAKGERAAAAGLQAIKRAIGA